MRDYVLNGVGHGPVGAAFNVTSRLSGRFDPGLLRPFIETDPNSPDVGHPCASLAVGMIYNNAKSEWEVKREKRRITHWQSQGIHSPVFNATTWTRDDWIQIDRAVTKPPRQPLNAWADLVAASTVPAFDAWGKLTYEYNAGTDSHSVVKDMDATSPARNDTSTYIIRSVPLPVIHGDAEYPKRFLDMTRGAGMPADTSAIEQITQRGWELVEDTLIGTVTGITAGGRATGPFPHTGDSEEYGYTNFPYRVTKTDLTTPTGSNPEAVKTDVQEMILSMNNNGFYGPFILYYSTSYEQWLADDYFRSGSTSAVRSVRERLLELGVIADVRPLRRLTSGYQLILVDLMAGYFSAIDGMKPTVVQWDERSGMLQKLMVMMIQTPLLKATTGSVSPLVHGTTS